MYQRHNKNNKQEKSIKRNFNDNFLLKPATISIY